MIKDSLKLKDYLKLILNLMGLPFAAAAAKLHKKKSVR